MNILIIEDDRDIAEGVAEYLRARGHTADLAFDGESGLARALGGDAELIVLDRMLPRLDGLEILHRLRKAGIGTPVILLTALDALPDRLEGFGAGADDYLPKPFAVEELEARLLALHRRGHAPEAPAQTRLQVGDLTFNLDTLQAERNRHSIALTPTTRRLLECLMRASPRVVTRDELQQLLWGDNAPEDDVLRIHMHALRSAIDRPFATKLLHTVHGVGYRLAGSGH